MGRLVEQFDRFVLDFPHIYMYIRLKGWRKITILATSNFEKQDDILRAYPRRSLLIFI